MSETVEIFQALKGLSKERRAGNREKSAQLLTEHGIGFTSKNDGAHLIVSANGLDIDFWPGTGLWTIRQVGKSRRGVFKLIKYVQEQQPCV